MENLLELKTGNSQQPTVMSTSRTVAATPRPTIGPTSPFIFYQFDNQANAYRVNESRFLATPFASLCPGGNCIQACKDQGRLFRHQGTNAANATFTTADLDGDGSPGPVAAEKPGDVTFFGICTNLGNATALALEQSNASPVRSFFADPRGVASINATAPPESQEADPVAAIALNIAECFSDTCDITKNPKGKYHCGDACSTSVLLSGGALEVAPALRVCAARLCSDSSVLPYADQDVLGIGVLVSYYIQGILLLICTVVFMASAARQMLVLKRPKPILPQKLRSPMNAFLSAQAYFGISAAVASFAMEPAMVDALNGYALLSVVVMGFLCPVYTLFLLSTHTTRLPRFGLLLTMASWAINSVVFYMLVGHLDTFGKPKVQGSLRQLFEVSSCAGSSAMMLCEELVNITPFTRLFFFFNRRTIVNIRLIPLLWGWATLVLLGLLVLEVLKKRRSRRAGPGHVSNQGEKRKANPPSGTNQTASWRRWTVDPIRHILSIPAGKLSLMCLICIMFVLCLAYEYELVHGYSMMNVIDKVHWTFGQVVAVLFWIPPFLDAIHELIGKKSNEDVEDENGARGRQAAPLLGGRGGRGRLSGWRPWKARPSETGTAGHVNDDRSRSVSPEEQSAPPNMPRRATNEMEEGRTNRQR